MYRVPIENLKKSFYKYLNFSKNSHNRFYLLSLRLLDIILSVIGLIILFSLVPFLFFVNLFANKGPLFLASGALLTVSGLMQWQARNAPCPVESDLAAACMRLRRFSHRILIGSALTYGLGVFFAYLWPLIYI